MSIGLLDTKLTNKKMFNQIEQDFLDNFRIETELVEMKQAQELIQGCSNKYQFAKTHSMYVKDWEKTRAHMVNRINSNQSSANIRKPVTDEMLRIADSIIKEKLDMVKLAFEMKFGESIFNYLGPDGKTKKIFGIF